MASRYNRTQIAHARIPALAATMLRFDRNTLAGFVEVAVAILDCSDGDPDIELNGDETDHGNTEECFIDHRVSRDAYPGRPISDTGGDEHDGREEQWE